MSSKSHCSQSMCPLTRRQFIGGCAGCAASLSAFSVLNAFAAGSSGPELPSGSKAKVKIVFTHINPDTATWPNI